MCLMTNLVFLFLRHDNDENLKVERYNYFSDMKMWTKHAVVKRNILNKYYSTHVTNMNSLKLPNELQCVSISSTFYLNL